MAVRRNALRLLHPTLMLCVHMSAAQAQTYPTKPMHFVISAMQGTEPEVVAQYLDRTVGTDAGLLFTGKLTSEFIAMDQADGKDLWHFKTGSSINSQPITFTHKGRQYITILSGRGGSNPTRYAASVVPSGGSVTTFALMQD